MPSLRCYQAHTQSRSLGSGYCSWGEAIGISFLDAHNLNLRVSKIRTIAFCKKYKMTLLLILNFGGRQIDSHPQQLSVCCQPSPYCVTPVGLFLGQKLSRSHRSLIFASTPIWRYFIILHRLLNFLFRPDTWTLTAGAAAKFLYNNLCYSVEHNWIQGKITLFSENLKTLQEFV